MFRSKLEELEPDIEEILKMEYGEKMINSCETQVKWASHYHNSNIIPIFFR